MKVSDYMSRPVRSVMADENHHSALRLVQDNALHHVPVTDGDNKLVGILAERDLLLAAAHYLQTPVRAGEVMHRDVITASPDLPLEEAARRMLAHNIGCLPVVDDENRLLGIITESDLFRALINVLSDR